MEFVRNSIASKFSELLQILTQIEEEKNKLLEETKEKVTLDKIDQNKVDEQTDAELERLTQLRNRINAFIQIAKMCYTGPVDEVGPNPVDINALAILQVQINLQVKNSLKAKELLEAATGQLLSVDQAIAEIRKNKPEKDSRAGHELMAYVEVFEILEKRFNAVIESGLMQELVALLDKETAKFADIHSVRPQDDNGNEIAIGTISIELPIHKEYRGRFKEYLKDYYDEAESTLKLPYYLDVNQNDRLYIMCNSKTKHVMYSGIYNYILNCIYHSGTFEKGYYVDPTRYRGPSYVAFDNFRKMYGSDLCFFSEGYDKDYKAILELLNKEVESTNNIFVYSGYPQAYEPAVMQLLTDKFLTDDNGDMIIIQECLEDCPTLSVAPRFNQQRIKKIYAENDSFYIDYDSKKCKFNWYICPPTFPRVEKETVEASKFDNNEYTNVVGLDWSGYDKGNRTIKGIPYGLDGKGRLLTIGFEDNYFASFISGASRSGKSTMLHTFLTGIFKTKHPDDIEVWLIDFKMTEFSRYVGNTPPHVRYILLDESPELVFDIVDRLMEILQKRQNIFKGKYQKLQDVPIEKYMPELFVIIDEFSIMSEIISDSDKYGKDDYTIKMQTLLAKGAALGFRFIFSSQGFTSGSRGLNDFAKKQIQQRISLKTEYSEILSTMDLVGMADGDRSLVQNLEPHYALTKSQPDEYGNRLTSAHILYLSDNSKQEQLIDKINRTLYPTAKYEPANNLSYIDKQLLVVDGNTYSIFNSEIKMRALSAIEGMSSRELLMILGEPRRMFRDYPVVLGNEFGENILMVAPTVEEMPALSILLSILNSLELQNVECDIITSGKYSLFGKIPSSVLRQVRVADSCSEIKRLVKEIKKSITHQDYSKRVVMVLGVDLIIREFEIMKDEPIPEKIERRESGALDLLSQMELGIMPTSSVAESEEEQLESGAERFDIVDELNYILKNGPSMGCHFIASVHNYGEFMQTGLNKPNFRHKVMFKIPKDDAWDLIGSKNSKIMEAVDSRVFVYDDGINCSSFRPYLHEGCEWDGFSTDGHQVIVEEVDDYLL